MPTKPVRTKPKAQFAVVRQSYEDPEAEDVPKPVLVPVSAKTRQPIQKPAVRFLEEMDDFDDHRLNMRMVDDEVEDRIFEDEVEEDFDEGFIKQMMTGDGVIDSDEEYDEFEDEDEYPQHADYAGRMIDRQFDRAMHDFDMDADLEEEDPRTHGPLDVMDYAPALEEFVQEHAGVSYAHPEEYARNRGLVNQFRNLSMQHRVFDSNAEGHFVVTLDADKGRRMANYFAEDNAGLKDLTLRQVRDGTIDTHDVLFDEDDDHKAKLVPVRIPRKERHDVETVLSTYTNVYNNPTVVAAQTKKVQLSTAAARKAKEEAAAARKAAKADATKASAGKKSPAMGPARIGPGAAAAVPALPADDDDRPAPAGASGPTEEDLWADLPDEALPSMSDLSQRPKDETKEEKMLRRALVKEMQRERRAEKKATKSAYKQASAAHAAVDPRQKLDKKLIPMSVVRRV